MTEKLIIDLASGRCDESILAIKNFSVVIFV